MTVLSKKIMCYSWFVSYSSFIKVLLCLPLHSSYMSQKQTFHLDSPARKFFACQLQHCSLSHNRTEGQWLYKNGNVKFCFDQVWVQGIVVLVGADGNDFLLDDGTGITEVTGVTKLVRDFSLHKGRYCG